MHEEGEERAVAKGRGEQPNDERCASIETTINNKNNDIEGINKQANKPSGRR